MSDEALNAKREALRVEEQLRLWKTVALIAVFLLAIFVGIPCVFAVLDFVVKVQHCKQ